MIAPAPLTTKSSDFENLYYALRVQARRCLRREQNAGSLSPTLLVHEAWLALANGRPARIADSTHYIRLVSHVMKNILIDRARRRCAATHGGNWQRVEWNDAGGAAENNCDLTLAIADALERLNCISPRLATLVELRYFAGFTEAETAQILGISVRSVRRQWRVARLRLLDFLGSEGKQGKHADD